MAKKIMLVDDASFMRMFVRDTLQTQGYEIVGEAENGEVAVDKYKRLQPDLVIMDITMDKMDGVQATREIRKLNPIAKIIMCSAMGQQAMVIDAIQAGASDFIVKPFQKEKLISSIRKLIG